jgi:ribosome-associated heat shock protein Hsp15
LAGTTDRPAGTARQRIDKWLWFARVVKTRTLAQKLAVSGSVRINRQKCDSASQTVKAGDVLTIALDRRVRVLKVVQPGTRRGGPADAKLLYQDLSPPPSPVPEPAAQAVRPQGAGRPSKRDHRRLLALKFGPRDDFSSGEE